MFHCYIPNFGQWFKNTFVVVYGFKRHNSILKKIPRVKVLSVPWFHVYSIIIWFALAKGSPFGYHSYHLTFEAFYRSFQSKFAEAFTASLAQPQIDQKKLIPMNEVEVARCACSRRVLGAKFWWNRFLIVGKGYYGKSHVSFIKIFFMLIIFIL